jgi:hypothetical protein
LQKTIRHTGESLELSDGALKASVAAPVRFGHLGCRTLGKVLEDRRAEQRAARKQGIRPLPDLPDSLLAHWDREVPGWRKGTGAAKDAGGAFRQAVAVSHARGLELWDTMRVGSDYWRPGKLLTQAVELAAVPVEYARLDVLCPPASLLEEFQTTSMGFPEYAGRYVAWLEQDDRIDLAVAGVIRAQARGLLAVFYCTDPFVPGYAVPSEFASEIPFAKRSWPLAGVLRDEGCHRVVLADLIARRLASLGVGGVVVELDPTVRGAKAREFRPIPRAR